MSEQKPGIPSELQCEVLHETKWLKLLNLKDPAQGVHGYVCTHAAWTDGKAVAVLPFRTIVGGFGGELTSWREYLLRQEVTPCWGMDPALSSITGGMDKPGEPAVECASRELHEEGGYIVPAARVDLWYDLGVRRMGKASTTLMHMFAVDLTAEAKVEAPGDGTELEAKAYCEWRKDPESAVDVLVGSMVFALHMAIDVKRDERKAKAAAYNAAKK
jgi:8-oxo-dGTP pyrophosphatase MutT (NUDIX family)